MTSTWIFGCEAAWAFDTIFLAIIKLRQAFGTSEIYRVVAIREFGTGTVPGSLTLELNFVLKFMARLRKGVDDSANWTREVRLVVISRTSPFVDEQQPPLSLRYLAGICESRRVRYHATRNGTKYEYNCA